MKKIDAIVVVEEVLHTPVYPRAGLSEPSRGCLGPPPRFWQISYPYLNQGGQIVPTALLRAPRIFRPSYGPAAASMRGAFN